MKKRIRLCSGVGVFLIALLVYSCTHTPDQKERFDLKVRTAEDVANLHKLEDDLQMTPEKAASHGDFKVVEDIPVPNVPAYRIGPGDVVEIVYHIRYEKTPEDYRLEVQDKISVTFPFHPQFSTTVVVRTDGKITVPMIGDVAAESKTPRELTALLNKKYSAYINNPSITVALEEFNTKIDELKKAITTAPRGQSKIAPVTPDGRIAFPIIGNLQAEGLSLSQLEGTVNQKYTDFIRNLHATLILLEIHNAKFYIVGEVEKPGAYAMPQRVNLVDALAMANGHKKSAHLKEVVVFRNDGLERPIAFKVDLHAVLEKGISDPNLTLRPADIIYVPRGPLDKFNDLVAKVFTKGLYAIFPFQTVFNIDVFAGNL
jgi:polysaccharide biosynthesis/export protein